MNVFRVWILLGYLFLYTTGVFSQQKIYEPTELFEMQYESCTSKTALKTKYLEISKSTVDKSSQYLNEIAYAKVLSRLGYPTDALRFLKLHAVVYEKSRPEIEAEYLATLGSINYNSENPSLAQKYVNQSISLLTRNDIKKGLAAKYSSLVSILVALKEYDAALNAYQNGKQFAAYGSAKTQLYLEMNLAVAYLSMNRLEAAKATFQDALRNHKATMNPIAEIRTYGNLGDIYLQQDSLELADKNYRSGLSASETKGLQLEQIRFHHAFYTLALAQDDCPTALAHLKQYQDLREMVDIQAATEKTKELELLHQENIAKEKALRQATILRIERQQKRWLLVGIALLSLLLGAILWLWIKTRKKNQLLYEKTIQLSTVKDAKPVDASSSNASYTEIIEALENFVLGKGMYAQSGLTMDKIAKKIGTNRSYLSEAINAHYNVNFTTWINQIRIEKSIAKLIAKEYQHYSIEGVAKEVGFSSISVFNSHFKRITGLTPSYFRNKSINN